MNIYCKQVFRLTNRAFVLVFATYMLDVVYAKAGMFGLGLFLSPFFLVLKVFLYAGVYGVCLDILLESHFQLTFKRVVDNCKKFYWIYVVSVLLTVIMHAGLSTYSTFFSTIDLLQVKNHFQILFYPLIAIIILYIKHLKPNKIRIKPVPASVTSLLLICILYSLDMLFFYIPQFFNFPLLEVERITLFASRYLQFYLFFYIAFLVVSPYKKDDCLPAHTKELYLINPNGKGVVGFLGKLVARYYPPFFLVLRALTPSCYKITEFNQHTFFEEDYKPGKLVAITSYTANSYIAYKIAKKFKEKGSTVIMGGPHVNFLSEEALEFCDSVLIGEAEGIWPKIIQDYEKGTLQKKYEGYPLEKFCSKTDDFILKTLEQQPKIYLETTRGCKYNCDFCVNPGLSFKKIRHRPVENIVQMVKKIRKKIPVISFLDNNIFSDPDYAHRLFEALKKLKIKWIAPCTLDIAKDEKCLDLMKKSGCLQILIGYEIFDSSPERKKRGKYSLSSEYISLSRKIKRKGLGIKAQFILGFESDTYNSLWELWKFCFKLRPSLASISLLTPLPGSNFYIEMLKEDRLINLNWSNYSMDKLVFRHIKLSEKLIACAYYPVVLVFFLTTTKLGNVFLFVALTLHILF